jgi:hypothetical protein
MVLTTETGHASHVLTTLRALTLCKYGAAEAAVLVKECFPNFDVYLRMREKDISNIADDYAKRTNAQLVLSFNSTTPMILKGLV